jgi:hypothetical protein
MDKWTNVDKWQVKPLRNRVWVPSVNFVVHQSVFNRRPAAAGATILEIGGGDGLRGRGIGSLKTDRSPGTIFSG